MLVEKLLILESFVMAGGFREWSDIAWPDLP